MTERPSGGGRWIRDPDTRALTPHTDAAPAPDTPAAVETPASEAETPASEAVPARRQKKGD